MVSSFRFAQLRKMAIAAHENDERDTLRLFVVDGQPLAYYGLKSTAALYQGQGNE